MNRFGRMAGLAWCLAASNLVAEDDSLGTQGGVLRLPVDRRVAQQLAVAAEHLANGETARALPLLEELWLRHGEGLVGDDQNFEALQSRVLQLIQQLQDVERRHCWSRIEAASVDSSTAALLRLPTPAGLRALWRAGADYRDRGEQELAAATYARAARHPDATDRQSLLADLLRIEQLAEVHGPAVIESWLKTAPEKVRRQSLLIAGEQTVAEAWLMRRISAVAPPRESALPELDRPALTPLWRWEAFPNDEIKSGLKQSVDEFRAQGIARLSTCQPAIIGSRFAVRTPWGLTCLALETGNVVWTAEDRVSSSRSLLASHQQNHLFQARLFAKLMLPLTERMQVKTLPGSLSHDRDTIYQVVESSASSAAPPSANRYALEAISVATGQPLWRIGEPSAADDPWWQSLERQLGSRELPDRTDFSLCGPPLVLGTRLYFLGTLSADLIFFAVDQQTRQVEWSTVVGHVLPDSGRPAPRAYTACPVIWTGELLVCPTVCGAIVALDPLQRRLRWATRIPVETLFHHSPGADPAVAPAIAEVALRSWREAAILQFSGKLICVSPESQAIHVLDEATGRAVCTIPRGNGLKLLGVTDDRVLVLEPTAIRAHDLVSGELAWRTAVGEVRGQGTIRGDRVVQGLAEGSVVVIEVRSGRRVPGTVRSDNAFGTLIPLPDGWLSVDEFQVTRFPDLAAARAAPFTVTDAASQVARGQLDLEAGDFTAVRNRLQSSDDEGVHALLRQADLTELRFQPDRAGALRDELLKRSATREVRGEALWALAEAALEHHQPAEALQDCLDGLSLGLQGEFNVGGETVRRVRWDRAFQGTLAMATRALPVDAALNLEQIFADRWNAARDSADPFALQQLYQQTKTLPWNKSRFLRERDAVFLGLGPLNRELSLLEAGGTRDEATRLLAAWTLRHDWRESGFSREAADIERQLLRDSPGGLLAPALTVRQKLHAEGTDVDLLNRQLNHGPDDPWPLISPKVTTEAWDVREEAHLTSMPVETDGGALWNRLHVAVDRTGRRLQFSGDGHSGFWSVELPSSSTGVHPYSFRAWTVGRLLIVRIGTLLAAVAPLNEQGAPEAKVVWSLDLLGTTRLLPEQLLIERVATKWKCVDDLFRVVDGFNRDLGHVGPVRAGYLCFLQQGKLVAVETLTGRLLWERWDVAPGAVALGNDEEVLLWEPERQMISVLQAADGRNIRQRSCPVIRREIWHESAGLVWTGQVAEELAIACRDLIQDRIVWQRTFPLESQPIALDHRTGAVIDPRGCLHLFDLATGIPIDEALTIDVPQPLERLFVHRDEARWYFGLSGTIDRPFDWQSTQPYLGYRRPLVHGPLYAIERATREIVWKRELAGEPWLIDQHPSAPVLVQIFKSPAARQGQGVGEGVLRAIDKRTGRELFTRRDFNLLPYVAVSVHPDAQRIEIKTESQLIQLDYDPQPEEPQ